MNIDKIFFMKLINEGKEENSYLLNLYKIYELCRKLSNGNIKKHKDLLNEEEDKIYTVNGQVLSQQDRIIFEIKQIYNKICSNIKDEKKRSIFISQLRDVSSKINFNDKNSKSEINQDELYFTVKQMLSKLQAELNMPIKFLYSASTLFMDIYETEYLNSKQFLGDILNDDGENDKTNIYTLPNYKDGGK